MIPQYEADVWCLFASGIKSSQRNRRGRSQVIRNVRTGRSSGAQRCRCPAVCPSENSYCKHFRKYSEHSNTLLCCTLNLKQRTDHVGVPWQLYIKRLLLNPPVTGVFRASWLLYSPTSWRPIRRSVGASTSSSPRPTTSCTGPWSTSSVCSRQHCTTSTSTSTTRKTQRPSTHRAPSAAGTSTDFYIVSLV